MKTIRGRSHCPHANLDLLWPRLRHPRPYRPPLEPEEAEQNLRNGAGTQWDPRLVEVFLAVLKQREPVAA